MTRPEDLPDFVSPPLDEVVVGVQFQALPGYTVVNAKDVWELFQDSYPHVQEMPPLEPAFETFGGSNTQFGSMQFQISNGPVRNRLWFISDEQDHLLQFQEDRLILNWRKRHQSHTYPRFEGVFDTFVGHLRTLDEFYPGKTSVSLDINQAEVTYVNILPVDDYASASDWFTFLELKGLPTERLNLAFDEVIKDKDKKPYARLTYELQAVMAKDNKAKAFRFSLTFRGKPSTNNIAGAIDFAQQGRENIVKRFTEMTTKKAHEIWGRTQ